MAYPKSWTLLQQRSDTLMFVVSARTFQEFETYYERAGSYEPWMFFFGPTVALACVEDVEPQDFGPPLLLEPRVPWSELLRLDGDSGFVLCYLVISPATDRLVAELVETGVVKLDIDV